MIHGFKGWQIWNEVTFIDGRYTPRWKIAKPPLEPRPEIYPSIEAAKIAITGIEKAEERDVKAPGIA